MSPLRVALVLAVPLVGCSGNHAPGEPQLSLTVTPSFITTDGQSAILNVQATAPDGSPGSGSVTLDAIAGQIAGGNTLPLGGDGAASTRYQCFLQIDPGCAAKSMRIIGTWSTGSQHAQSTVTLTLLSPDGGP
jgi:hypothetical protein